MDTMKLFKFLENIHPLSDDFKEALSGKLLEEHFRTRQIILSLSQMSNRVWFIQRGSAMASVLKGRRKIPIQFWDENEVMMSVKSFFGRSRAECTIELMEESTLLSISYDEVLAMFAAFPEASLMARTIVEDYENQSTQRIIEFTTLTPEQRFTKLLKAHSFILKKAPVQDIASYLGVSRKTYHRIRSAK